MSTSFESTTANGQWVNLLANLIRQGREVNPRAIKTRELICQTSCVDMRMPLVTINRRKLGYRFLLAEALWILNGDARVWTISGFSKEISKFSDNGMYFQGAYGPMVVQQLDYVVDSLVKDRDSRQAVMTIWRPNPRPSKDIPCTVSVQFLIRDNKLYCLDTMRSSDTWLGWPYDVFNFSMLSAVIALMLRAKGLEVDLGRLLLTAGSQHLYEANESEALHCLDTAQDHWEYTPLDINDFHSAQEFMSHLQDLLADHPNLVEWEPGDFLYELRNRFQAIKNRPRPSPVGDPDAGAGDKPKTAVRGE